MVLSDLGGQAVAGRPPSAVQGSLRFLELLVMQQYPGGVAVDPKRRCLEVPECLFSAAVLSPRLPVEALVYSAYSRRTVRVPCMVRTCAIGAFGYYCFVGLEFDKALFRGM